MAYGPVTSVHIGKLASGEIFTSAKEWDPEEFTLPFADRLLENIGDYYDLPPEETARKTAVTSIISKGAQEKGFRFSKSTLSEWLSGGRDPSVSSSDAQTRENIYKLCAALNYNYEQTLELFEKVFFTRSFNPKNLKELAFRFFASRDYEAEKEGCAWYNAGLRATSAAEEREADNTAENPIQDSVLIFDQTELMDEEEFIAFLAANPATFLPDNQHALARKAVKEYMRKACKLTPEIRNYSDSDEIPYESLISSILGFSQRNSTEAAGGISQLKSLPLQLTTNFPTGQILRKICLDDGCSYDQIYKMLSLLLFYCFFSTSIGSTPAERNFRSFLRFSNLELDKAGCTEMYPGQPYSGLLLFCATKKNPIQSLRVFLEARIEEESEAILQEEMKTFLPKMKNSTCLTLIRACDRNPFSVRILSATLRRSTCTANLASLLENCEDEELLLQYLYDQAGFSAKEKALLRYCSLLPPEGISPALEGMLFDKSDSELILCLINDGWLISNKNMLSMNYRIRHLVQDQLDFPTAKNCAPFIQRIGQASPDQLSPEDLRRFKKIQKKIRQL